MIDELARSLHEQESLLREMAAADASQEELLRAATLYLQTSHEAGLRYEKDKQLARRIQRFGTASFRDSQSRVGFEISVRCCRLRDHFPPAECRVFLADEDSNCFRALLLDCDSEQLRTIPFDSNHSLIHVARSGAAWFTDEVCEESTLDGTQSCAVALVPLHPEQRTKGGLCRAILQLISGNDDVRNCGWSKRERARVMDASVEIGILADLVNWPSIDDDAIPIAPIVPWCDGWSMQQFTFQLCRAVSETWGRLERHFQCQFWSGNRPQGSLVLIGTSGYDSEYVADKTLPLLSHTGNVCTMERGSAVRIQPLTEALFVEKRKAEHHDLREIVSGPFGGHPEGQIQEARGAVHLYSFRETPQQELVTTSAIAELARIYGDWWRCFYEQRQKTAERILAHHLSRILVGFTELFNDNHATASRPEWRHFHGRITQAFHSLLHWLCRFTAADGGTIFLPADGRHGKGPVLRAVCSIGSPEASVWEVPQLHGRSQSRKPPEYDVGTSSKERGLIYWLFHHVGEVLCLDSTSQNALAQERGRRHDEGFPTEIVAHGMEVLEDDTADRRFLGLAVPGNGHVNFVIRLVRSSTKPAYFEEDATLLRWLLIESVAVRNQLTCLSPLLSQDTPSVQDPTVKDNTRELSLK